jgi:hypothetical protein
MSPSQPFSFFLEKKEKRWRKRKKINFIIHLVKPEIGDACRCVRAKSELAHCRRQFPTLEACRRSWRVEKSSDSSGDGVEETI